MRKQHYELLKVLASNRCADFRNGQIWGTIHAQTRLTIYYKKLNFLPKCYYCSTPINLF